MSFGGDLGSGLHSVVLGQDSTPLSAFCLVTMSCPTLCDPMDGSPPDSSVHAILQARILEWVVMSSPPRDLPDAGIKTSSLISPALAI